MASNYDVNMKVKAVIDDVEYGSGFTGKTQRAFYSKKEQPYFGHIKTNQAAIMMGRMSGMSRFSTMMEQMALRFGPVGLALGAFAFALGNVIDSAQKTAQALSEVGENVSNGIGKLDRAILKFQADQYKIDAKDSTNVGYYNELGKKSAELAQQYNAANKALIESREAMKRVGLTQEDVKWMEERGKRGAFEGFVEGKTGKMANRAIELMGLGPMWEQLKTDAVKATTGEAQSAMAKTLGQAYELGRKGFNAITPGADFPSPEEFAKQTVILAKMEAAGINPMKSGQWLKDLSRNIEMIDTYQSTRNAMIQAQEMVKRNVFATIHPGRYEQTLVSGNLNKMGLYTSQLMQNAAQSPELRALDAQTDILKSIKETVFRMMQKEAGGLE